MKYGLRKSLEDIAFELKGIKNILGSMWHSRYSNGEIDTLNPEAYADEYISTEECGKRLGVSDQTIRNWIAIGRRDPNKGWKEGIHFVNVSPDPNRKAVLRVPWNQLVQSFSKNRDLESRDLRGKGDHENQMYKTDRGFLE
jgi:transposase